MRHVPPPSASPPMPAPTRSSTPSSKTNWRCKNGSPDGADQSINQPSLRALGAQSLQVSRARKWRSGTGERYRLDELARHSRRPRQKRRSGARPDPKAQSLMLGSDLDFEAHLDDLSGRDAEIGGRQIGVEMHRGKEPLPPHGHPGHLAARDDHDPSRIKGDPLRVDAAQVRVAASKLQPLHHIGMFHKPEIEGNPGNAGADGCELYALVRIDARRIATDRRDQQHTLVQ